MQSFIGQVNFLRRFIPSFSEIMKNITNMLNKENKIKWTLDARNSFKDIKKAVIEAPVLVIPYFTKYFLVSSYAYEHTIVQVLLQRNSQNAKQPISSSTSC